METILITGGTGLIGRAQVQHFLSRGYRVALTYRNEEKIEPFRQSPHVIALKAPDLLASEAPRSILSALETQGIFPEHFIHMATDTRWHRMEPDGSASRECMINHYIVHVVFPYELAFLLAQQAASRLQKIIFISSMYGVVPYNPQVYSNPLAETPLQYSVSKSALLHLTKELAIRLRERGIAVNAVSYGGVEGRAQEDLKARLAQVTPLRRMMLPAETIPAVEFLLTEDSHYMTGQNIIVDGGRTVW